MKGKIIDKKEIAQGTLLVKFEVQEPFTFQAGQYFFVTLPELKYPDTRGNRRHFSIVNAPQETGIIVMATRIREESGFKKTLRDLELGTEVELGPIAGNFNLPEKYEKPLVFIAGGIGITPFMSMLSYIQKSDLPYAVTLLYSNKDKDSTAFFDELSKISQENPRIKTILIMTEDENWQGEKRHIDKTFITEYFPDVNAQTFFVAGPPAMVEAIVNSLQEAGVEEKNVISENFSGY